MQAELIVNRRSRRSSGGITQLQKALVGQEIEITHVHHLSRSTTIADTVAAVKRRSPKLVIVAGGDGTISSVANRLAGTNIELGIIPLGTTNNFARSLNIPFEQMAAIEIIAKAPARAVDLGKAGAEYFTSVAGIGLSALIAKSVHDSTKKRWGRLAYPLTATRLLLSHKAFTATITDQSGDLTQTFETHQLIVANGRYHAGKEIAEDAKIDDGQLVLFALGGRSKLSLMWHMTDFYIGKRKRLAHSSRMLGKDIYIETDRPQLIELDGEVKTKTPLALRVESATLQVRYKK